MLACLRFFCTNCDRTIRSCFCERWCFRAFANNKVNMTDCLCDAVFSIFNLRCQFFNAVYKRSVYCSRAFYSLEKCRLDVIDLIDFNCSLCLQTRYSIVAVVAVFIVTVVIYSSSHWTRIWVKQFRFIFTQIDSKWCDVWVSPIACYFTFNDIPRLAIRIYENRALSFIWRLFHLAVHVINVVYTLLRCDFLFFIASLSLKCYHIIENLYWNIRKSCISDINISNPLDSGILRQVENRVREWEKTDFYEFAHYCLAFVRVYLAGIYMYFGWDFPQYPVSDWYRYLWFIMFTLCFYYPCYWFRVIYCTCTVRSMLRR